MLTGGRSCHSTWGQAVGEGSIRQALCHRGGHPGVFWCCFSHTWGQVTHCTPWISVSPRPQGPAECHREAGHTPLGSWRWPTLARSGPCPCPRQFLSPQPSLGRAGKHRLHRPVQLPSSGWGWSLAGCGSSQAWLGTDWLGVARRWDATAPDCPGGALSRCCWASVGQGIREASGGKVPCPPTISWV